MMQYFEPSLVELGRASQLIKYDNGNKTTNVNDGQGLGTNLYCGLAEVDD